MKPSFRENLRAYMTSAGVNQAELAHRVRVSTGVVSRWLSGETTLPDAQVYFAIVKVLGIADPWMLIGSSFEDPEPPRNVAPPGRKPKPVKDAQLEPLLELTPRKPAAIPKSPPSVARATRRTRNERE